MPVISDYEKLRQENIDQNKKILKELGLLNAFQRPVFAQKPVIKQKKVRRKIIKRVDRSQSEIASQDISIDVLEKAGAVRRSGRIKGKPPKRFCGMAELRENDLSSDYEYSEDSDEEVVRKRRHQHQPVPKNRDNIIGAVPGVAVGKCWEFRSECSFDGVHRPLVAGIHGNEKGGCFSIALSGGYEDDLDYGEYFTYTGCGGRDLRGTKNKPKNLRTAPQSKDQALGGPNLALSMNVESKQPVRVIRGFKLQSPYAPEQGYRYDGLYTVERFWFTTGMSGFGVYKFALRRCEDQPPPAWHYTSDSNSASESGCNSKEAEPVDSVPDSPSFADQNLNGRPEVEHNCRSESHQSGEKPEIADLLNIKEKSEEGEDPVEISSGDGLTDCNHDVVDKEPSKEM